MAVVVAAAVAVVDVGVRAEALVAGVAAVVVVDVGVLAGAQLVL